MGKVVIWQAGDGFEGSIRRLEGDRFSDNAFNGDGFEDGGFGGSGFEDSWFEGWWLKRGDRVTGTRIEFGVLRMTARE